MPRFRRGLAAAAGTALCLLIPMPGHALDRAERAPARASARRPASRAEISTIRPQDPAPPVVVTTVSVPGGISASMRAALQGPETLFTPASRDVNAWSLPDGTRVLTSPSRFLSVLVLAADAEGGSSLRCVSTLDDAVHVTPGGRVPVSGAEKE